MIQVHTYIVPFNYSIWPYDHYVISLSHHFICPVLHLEWWCLVKLSRFFPSTSRATWLHVGLGQMQHILCPVVLPPVVPPFWAFYFTMTWSTVPTTMPLLQQPVMTLFLPCAQTHFQGQQNILCTGRQWSALFFHITCHKTGHENEAWRTKLNWTKLN